MADIGFRESGPNNQAVARHLQRRSRAGTLPTLLPEKQLPSAAMRFGLSAITNLLPRKQPFVKLPSNWRGNHNLRKVQMQRINQVVPIARHHR
jgi:hypothetical protein